MHPSYYKMSQQKSNEMRPDINHLINDHYSTSSVRQRPTSTRLSPKPSQVPPVSKNDNLTFLIDLNLATSAENMANLLNIKPVEYRVDVESELTGMVLKKKRRFS